MADTLDNRLAPGEAVIYRDPPKPWIGDWPRTLGAAILVCAIWLIVMGRIDALVALTVLGLLIVFAALAGLLERLWFPSRELTAETILTEDRLMHWSGARQDSTVEIPLADITGSRVSWTGSLIVMTHGEGVIELGPLRQPSVLASELARATLLPPPRLAGRLAPLWDLAETIGAALCFLVAVILLRGVLGLDHSAQGSAEFGPIALKIMTLYLASQVIGRHLAAGLGLVALRRRVSAAEAHAWLDLMAVGEDPESAWERFGAHLMLWRSPLYAWLVRVLWGTPKNGSNREAAGHG